MQYNNTQSIRPSNLNYVQLIRDYIHRDTVLIALDTKQLSIFI